METVPPAVLGEPTSHDPLVAQLHRAVLADQPRRVRRCLARGCRPDAVNAAGQTPLFCAAFAARRAAADELLRRGADPNARCDGGYTAVHGACHAGRLRVLRRLLECGGDLRLHDLAGRRPADWARLQPDPLRRRRVLQLIEMARLAALTPSGRDLLVERSNSFSGSGGGVRTLLRRLMPRETPRRAAAADEVDLADLARSVQSVGFGAVYYGGGEATPGALAVLPLVTERALEPDHATSGYPLGAYTEMAARLYLGAPVSVRRLLERPPPGGHRDLLIAELEAARRLHHPSLLLLMAVCPSENLDALTLVFERVPLGSLHHCRYQRGMRPSPAAAAELLLQVCAALQFMHAAGWLHCAVTSHAVQLLTPTHAKLACLEHALHVVAEPPRPQRRLLACRADGALYNWLAPEVLRDAVPSELADTYSFCALTWELIHGQVPWDGLSADEISAQAAGGGRALAVCADVCPAILGDMLELGLRADPQQRDLQLDEAKFLLSNLRGGGQKTLKSTGAVPAAQTPLARPATPVSRPATPTSRPVTPASTSRGRVKPPAPAPPRHVTPARLSRTLSPNSLRPPPGADPEPPLRQAPALHSTPVDRAACRDPYTGLRRTTAAGRHARSATWQTSPTATWEEATAIKPASHRLTRHGSSCSLNRRPAACASPWPPAAWDRDTPPAARRRAVSPRQHSVSLDGQSDASEAGSRHAEPRSHPAPCTRSPAAPGAGRSGRSAPRLRPLVSDSRGVTRTRPGQPAGRWGLRETEVQVSAVVTEAASQTAAGEQRPTAGGGSREPAQNSGAAPAPNTAGGSEAAQINGSANSSDRVESSCASGHGAVGRASTEPTRSGGSTSPPAQIHDSSVNTPTATNSSSTAPAQSSSGPSQSGVSAERTLTTSSEERMTSYSSRNFAARREFFNARGGGGATTAHSQSDSALRLPQGVRLNPALLLRRDAPPSNGISSAAASRGILLGQPRPFQRPTGAATVCHVRGTSAGGPPPAEPGGVAAPQRPAADRSHPSAVSSLSSGTAGSGANGHRLNVTFHAEVLEFSADDRSRSPPGSLGSDEGRCYYDDDLASPDAPPHLQLLTPPSPPSDAPPPPPLYPCLDDGGRASPLSMELPSSAAESELDDLPELGLDERRLSDDEELDQPSAPLTPLHVSESDGSGDEADLTAPVVADGGSSPCITSSEATRSDGSRVRLFEVACERGFQTLVETRARQDGQCTVTCTNTDLADGSTETYRQTVTADQVQTQIVVADR